MSSALAAITRGWTRLERFLGETDDQLRTARRLVVASGAVVVACAGVLVVDHGVAAGRAPGEKARIEALEAQTKEDDEIATRLHAERKRQTDASLARQTRGRVLAWLLLLSGGAFVASGQWFMSLRPQPLPSLDELVAVRFGAAVPVRTQGAREVRVSAASPSAVSENGTSEAVGPGFVDGLNRFDGGVVDDFVSRFGRDKEAAIPILQAIQAHYRYLPDAALRHVCEQTEITPAQIAGTSSFYSQFRRSPVGRHVVRVCHGTACHVAGAEQITDELRRHLEIPPGADTDSQRLFTLDKVACLGCCSLAPVMMVEEETAGRLTPATGRQALDAVAKRT